MVKLEKKQDLATGLFPITLGKDKKKKLLNELKNKEKVLKGRSGDLSTVRERKNLQNQLFIQPQSLEKRDEIFFMGLQKGRKK